MADDFNVSEAFEELVASLVQHRAAMHAIGIQSHMHMGPWTLEKVWQACEAYSRFGLPLHFTEVTLLSGRFKLL